MAIQPNSHLYPDWRQNADALLSAVASQICRLQVGPRFIAGDFNTELDSIPAFSILHDAGFKDVQDLACERWGLNLPPPARAKL